MKNETIRRIDVWGGNLVCAALTAHRKAMDLIRGGERTPEPPKKIVFIKLIEQGATVLAYGAILRAIEMVGKENVYFVVFEENRPILDLMDVVLPENILTIDHSNFTTFLGDTAKVLAKIRALDIDTSIDMEGLQRAPAILGYLTGAKTRVGLHRFTDEGPYRGDLMTHRMHHNPYLHVSTSFTLLMEALVADPKDIPLPKVPAASVETPCPRFKYSDTDRARARQVLEAAAGQPIAGPVVLLNPNCSDLLPIRKWEASRFVDLAKRLLAHDSRLHIGLTGAPSEKADVEAILPQIGSPRAFSLAGKTTLAQLLMIYDLCDVLVTNDSGPGHFSAMTDIDSIVIHGPETPALYGSIGARNHPLYVQMACSPCVNIHNHRFTPCTRPACMDAVTTDMVYAEVLRCLEQRQARRVGLTVVKA